MNRAIRLCNELRGTIQQFVVSSDIDWAAHERIGSAGVGMFMYGTWIHRPPELAQDDTPMIDVVKHAMQEITGQPEDIWLLVQPTQPLRQPKHLTAAIQLLQETGAESVVSVVEVPAQHVDLLWIEPGTGQLARIGYSSLTTRWVFENRQSLGAVYIRDGTVYAFRRSTVERYGTIYGQDVRPLIMDPSETCALDTPEDWAEAERRLLA